MHKPFLARLLPALLFLAGACRNAVPSSSDGPDSPPAVDFVLAAGDSAFWVTSDSGGIHTRGAPLELARFGGRFFELYVVDDDLSFQGAELTGQSLYRRDLRTGDSVIVFSDSIVPALAREYARLHPDDRRIAPDEYPDEDPLWHATATLDLGAAHGSFVSYSLHTDVERGAAPLWHVSRRGVLDLRTGRPASLASIVGPDVAEVERLRGVAMTSALDSVRGRQDERGKRASAQLAHYRMDPESFSLTTVEGGPAIEYALTGEGEGDAGHSLPLAPIRFGEPIWWRDVAASLPTSSADGRRDVWLRGRYAVVVRYDDEGGARLAVRDSTSKEWPVAQVSSPAKRIYWLDRPVVDGDTRHALSRAFDEAAGYGVETRVASRRAPPLFRFARNVKGPRPVKHVRQ